MKKANRYAICAVIFAISAWIFLIALLWEYAAFASTFLAIVFSVIAIFKKQNKILAIIGGTVALVLFIGMIIPSIIK